MGKYKKKNQKSSIPKPKSRKEIRKEKRMNKKKRRNNPRWELEKCEPLKDVPKDQSAVKNEKPIKENDASSYNKLLKERQKDQKQFRKLERQMQIQRKRQLLEANEEEDKVIRDLEKKLKLNKRKGKSLPKSFIAGGLDYLLEVCNYDKFKSSLNLEKELNEAGDEFEDDLALVTGSATNKNEIPEEAESDDDCSSVEDENENAGASEDDNTVSSENDFPDENLDESDAEERSVGELEDEAMPKVKKFKEDIYGRLRDDKGNIVESRSEKYIPPYKRAQTTNETNENLKRLAKQMKGFLNRLTERNMHSIATQMEDLYMNHSRHDVNSTLLKLLMDSLISPVLSPERIIIEHAMLITILHANIGSEIGATILQHMVEEYEKLFRANLCVEDKRIDNVVLFLCQLYNFKVFHARLIYDILNKFVEKFEEKNIELVLIVLKNIGFNLRKDDPVELKNFILKTHKCANESSALRENTRVRFMLDTLTAIKNNNMLKVPDFDPTYVDHLKKIQKSLLRPGKYVTELKIGLEDLFNADTKGKWWIVGSAWSGDKEIKSIAVPSQLITFDEKVLELARKQRMNTDTRRNIFCILMSAETYSDACERLLRLGLKGRQYQEILHVLMHCLLKEKRYNPYYAFIAEHFCSVDRKYQLAIQFSMWDRLKEIDSLKTKQISSLAKFLSYLFVEQKLPLSALKVLQFTEMNKKMVRLLRQILLAILLNDDESVIVETFSRISKSEKLLALREGLQLFLHHFVLKNVEAPTLEDESEAWKMKLLPKRVELAVSAMRGSSSDF